jgi:hypothetical protein
MSWWVYVSVIVCVCVVCMCARACVRVCGWVGGCVFVWVWLGGCVFLCGYVCGYVWVWFFFFFFVYVCVCVFLCGLSGCVYIYMCLFNKSVFVWMWASMCVCAHLLKQFLSGGSRFALGSYKASESMKAKLANHECVNFNSLGECVFGDTHGSVLFDGHLRVGTTLEAGNTLHGTKFFLPDECLGFYGGAIVERGTDGPFVFDAGESFIDAKDRGTLCRFANHTTEPNAALRLVLCNGFVRVGMFALRAVNKGEELRIDYQWAAYSWEDKESKTSI